MYIDEDADVIINDGTIKGGYSCNGAGGIHINDNANVTFESMKNIRIARWNDLGSASIFGEGSFSTVIALIALVSSLA